MNAPSPQPLELTIDRLGGMGDGISQHEGKPVYVARTCPGDVVKVMPKRETKDDIRADLLKIITPSSNRQDAPCQHFGSCGGCSLQHLNADTYRAFKQRSLESYVAGLGLDASIIAPMVEITEQSRRRVDIKIDAREGVIRAGFFAPKSHRLVDIETCPVSNPSLINILPAIKDSVAALKKPGRIISVNLTALDNGLDATVNISSALGTQDKQTLMDMAQANRILRLSLQLKEKSGSSRAQTIFHDPVCLYGKDDAVIAFGGVNVALPPGAFLQASREGEQAITERVTTHLKGCKTVADLYSGCGTYSFSLIKHAERISAYEGIDDMAAAMNNACVNAGLDGHMETTMRDLFTDPLTADELQPFDGIVMNPPRNGALPQAQEIAKSGVKKVVMVSCNPSTFKRDAKCLLEAGYTLSQATPIDQFYWSNHLELVALFDYVG